MTDLRARLQLGVQALQLELSAQQIEALLAYLALIAKWNKVYNLTAIRQADEMLTHHLLDSLAAVPSLVSAVQSHGGEGGSLAEVRGRVLDVGSGAGLPCIPLAICCPNLSVVSVDTVQKKTAFQTQVKAELRLANFTVCAARVESLTEAQTGGVFDVVTSRAFAELKDFVQWSEAQVAPEGCFLALKGVYPEEEIARLPTGWQVEKVQALSVPQLDVQRHVVTLVRCTATS